MSKTFSVKILNTEIVNGVAKTVLVSLGENLDWQTAVSLRKENAGSYTHPENRVYPKE